MRNGVNSLTCILLTTEDIYTPIVVFPFWPERGGGGGVLLISKYPWFP